MPKWGWKPQLPHFKDGLYAYRPRLEPEPNVVYNLCPPPRDQGNLGSCVFCSLASLMESSEIKNDHDDWWVFSPLFAYYEYRSHFGSIENDDGAWIREAIKILADIGVCRESLWPYRENNFSAKPSLEAYKDAANHQVLSYHAVPQSIDSMISCLSEGHNFVGGISVFENYENIKDGLWPMPKGKLLGGHALMFYGYDKHLQVFHGLNSWGDEWGRNGRFMMPFSYLADPGLASDFWTIRVVEQC